MAAGTEIEDIDSDSAARERESPQVETSAGGEMTQLAQALDVAFPDIKCLRCGSESFFLAGPAQYVYQGRNDISKDVGLHRYGGPMIETVDLICRRCGMIESHALNILLEYVSPATKVASNGQ